MKNGKSILLVGVGGQGILLASEVISQAAMIQGFDVKKSEIHGMSQRGGVVSSHVRYGEHIYSPLIGKASADVLLSFEKVESYRWIEYLRPGGEVITNTTEIVPPAVYAMGKEYPHDVIDRMHKQGVNVLAVDAASVAKGVGNVRAMNVVLLGVLSRKLSFPDETWQEALRARVPKRHLEVNLNAFEEGQRLAAS